MQLYAPNAKPIGSLWISVKPIFATNTVLQQVLYQMSAMALLIACNAMDMVHAQTKEFASVLTVIPATNVKFTVLLTMA